MSVKIQVLSHSDQEISPESNAALELQTILGREFAKFPSAKGDVFIGYSLTMSGQEVRDLDLLLFGEVTGVTLKSFFAGPADEIKRDVEVESFCYIIEVKDHTAKAVRTRNTHLYVNYRGAWKDVSDQSEAQKYSFMNYFKKDFKYNPLVCNLIWLRQVDAEGLYKIQVSDNGFNVLPSDFSLRDLVLQYINQINIEKFHPYQGCYHINASPTGTIVEDLKSLLGERSIAQGLTRRKMDLLVQKTVSDNLDKITDANRLTIFSGRAGTGKTFYLLQCALRLATPESGSRCLLLTYNYALVTDIRRMLHFMDVPDGIDQYSIQIKPLHDFFIHLMESLIGVTPHGVGAEYLNSYTDGIKKLEDYVQNALSDNDVTSFKEIEDTSLDWDYILVDEAQDWMEEEKSILFKLYGIRRIIVADGMDQFVRSTAKLHWERHIDTNSVRSTISLRQKSNLVTFVNAYAKACGLSWEVKPNKSLLGGYVKIIPAYSTTEHQLLEEDCRLNDCENYDLLLLVPPSMVKHDENERYFRYIDEFETSGIHVFDGTNPKNREQYSTDVSQSRLYQYDSCRGLEGWGVVCFDFDELIAYKQNIYVDNPQDSLLLESPEDRRSRFAYLWSIMPLTRPIDVLVITLRDPDSEVGQILHYLADTYPDFVEWDIEDSIEV